MKVFRVTVKQDEDGYWMAVCSGIQGCRTQGRSIATVRKRIREAIEVCGVDEPFDIELDLGEPAVKKLISARRQADKAKEVYAAQVKKTARSLTKHMSKRDAAGIIGLSYQRVSQILHGD